MGNRNGQLFVIDGDLTQLHCDAILVPVDRSLHATGTWSGLLGSAGRIEDAEVPAGWGDDVRAFRYRTPQSGPQIWLGCIGAFDAPSDWYAQGLVDFIERVSADWSLDADAHRPRVAVNVGGSGAGGLAHDKGHLFRTIVPALAEAAARLDVDVALVCWGEKQYAAAQRVRKLQPRAAEAVDSRGEALGAAAESIAQQARSSDLVLFVGAGVSMGAGLRSWQGLLDELLLRIDKPIEDPERLRQLDVRDQAHLISKHFATPEGYRAAFSDLLDSGRYSLAHGLLASLRTREAITTNYDDLYERAASTAGRTCAVLPYEPVLKHDRWLLKLHGTVDRPEEIVLTRHDYLGLSARAGALFGVLQAMLMTRHMLFVGYSLTDDSFHQVMHEVRQARGGLPGKLGTAIVLFDDPLLEELWGDELNIVAIAPRPSAGLSAADIATAARDLDRLLDHVGLLAADVTSFLLDPTYASMLDDEERALSKELAEAASLVKSGSGPIAERLQEQFARLGA